VKRWTLLEIWARTPRVALASFLILSLSILFSQTCLADDASAKAARELAQKIAAQIDHKKKVFVEVTDMTGTMGISELWSVKRAIEAELHARGGHPVDDTSYETMVRVILSHDPNQRLWVAEFDSEGARKIVIVPFEFQSLDVRPWMQGAHLDKELIFSANSQFLDFLPCESSTNEHCGAPLVLFPSEVMTTKVWESFPNLPFNTKNLYLEIYGEE
jgi:hypothetical protein